MVCSGCPERREDHADAVCRLALDMRAVAPEFQSFSKEKLEFQIGVNSGNIIAGVSSLLPEEGRVDRGTLDYSSFCVYFLHSFLCCCCLLSLKVIGMKYPRYRLMGDTVNTASRMCTTTEPGRVQLTQKSAVRVMKNFVLLDGGRRKVKGKDEMNVYYLIGPKDEGSEQGPIPASLLLLGGADQSANGPLSGAPSAAAVSGSSRIALKEQKESKEDEDSGSNVTKIKPAADNEGLLATFLSGSSDAVSLPFRVTMQV